MKRYLWIDWMKTLGMFFIIWGHFFSDGHKYVYVFSVPLFFFISGMLSKIEEDNTVFLKKIFYNLFLPMFFICLIVFTYNSIVALSKGTFSATTIPEFLYGFVLGRYSSVETCWFVYTLILLKLIFQYFRKSILQISLLLIFLIMAFFLNQYYHNHRPVPNAIVDVCTAYPWFFAGYLVKDYKEYFDNIKDRKILLGTFFLCLGLIFFCGKYNGMVFLFIASYGGNLLLFFLGGVAGIIAVFAISKMMDFDWGINKAISVGSILILGFHTRLISVFVDIFQKRTLIDAFFSLIILLAFIPLIKLCESYFPLILGKYRIKKSS